MTAVCLSVRLIVSGDVSTRKLRPTQRNAPTIIGVEWQIGELIDALFVAFAEGKSHGHFTCFSAKFTQLLAAHRDADIPGYFLGRQSNCGGAGPVDGYLNFAIAEFRIRANVLQAVYRCQQSCNIESDVIEHGGRVSRNLQTEAVATALLIKFKARLANRNHRQVFFYSLHHFRSRERRLILICQQNRQTGLTLFVVAVNGGNIERFLILE